MTRMITAIQPSPGISRKNGKWRRMPMHLGLRRRVIADGRPATPHRLNPEAGRDDGVFWYHHDSVSDEVIFRVHIRRFSFRGNDDAIADTRVTVHYPWHPSQISPHTDHRSP